MIIGGKGMKQKRSVLVLCIVVLLISALVFSGCGQQVEQEPENDSAVSDEETADEPVSDQTDDSATAEDENTGPQLNMLDVIGLEGTQANLVVTNVVEITEDSTMLEAGQKIISPWIFVKNTGSEPINVGYSTFILVDTDGTEYEASVYTPGVLYNGNEVLPGGIIEGPVYFVVPEQAQAYSVKAYSDLAWDDQNLVEVDLQQFSDDPGSEPFTATFEDQFSDLSVVDMNTAYNYDDKLSLQVTDSYFTEGASVESCESYDYYQIALTVENLTAEDLDITLDYTYMLYSPMYNHLVRQVALPFADNEMWVETLTANEKKDFVITFEAKADSTENYLFVQDFFEENAPVLLALNE
jgi:hypothetical protein